MSACGAAPLVPGKHSRGHGEISRNGTNSSTALPKTKRARVINILLPCTPLNRFEIERLAHDHVPNSTIAELRDDGLRIHSRLVRVVGFGGQTVLIAEYRLDESSRGRALELMTRTGRRRGKV